MIHLLRLSMLLTDMSPEEKVDDLQIEIDLKDSLLSHLREQLAAKDQQSDFLTSELEHSNAVLKKTIVDKDRHIADLICEIGTRKRNQDRISKVPSVDIALTVNGNIWPLDSLRTPDIESSAPGMFLYWAANSGNAGAVRHICNKTGADTSYFDPKTNMNALQVASKRGFFRVVDLLLSLDYTLGQDKALEYAACNGHIAIVRRLHERGAQIARLPGTALNKGAEGLIKLLIDGGAYVSEAAWLRFAVEYLPEEVAETLTTAGQISPSELLRVDDRSSALEWASLEGDLEKLCDVEVPIMTPRSLDELSPRNSFSKLTAC